MTDDWPAPYHAVLEGPEDRWWHVTDRYEPVDSDHSGRLYHLWDATHTTDRYVSALAVAEGYEDLGWTTDTKPAAERGYRVNGVLCQPAAVDEWLGTSCLSDHDCPECGATTQDAADMVVDIEDRDVASAELRCQDCGTTTEVRG